MVSGSMAFSSDSMVGTSWGMHLGTSELTSTERLGVVGVVGLGGLLCWTPFNRFNFLVLRAVETNKQKKRIWI